MTAQEVINYLKIDYPEIEENKSINRSQLLSMIFDFIDLGYDMGREEGYDDGYFDASNEN